MYYVRYGKTPMGHLVFSMAAHVRALLQLECASTSPAGDPKGLTFAGISTHSWVIWLLSPFLLSLGTLSRNVLFLWAYLALCFDPLCYHHSRLLNSHLYLQAAVWFYPFLLFQHLFLLAVFSASEVIFFCYWIFQHIFY